MELDRQDVPQQRDASGRTIPPQRVAETRPTPLREWFIYLSVLVLVCGVVAISALELGAAVGDPIVRLPLLIGAVVLSLLSADALVRVWRSAWAWLPVDRGRGYFRFVWAAVIGASLLGALAVVLLALAA